MEGAPRVTLSRNEVEGLGLKAARGAGFSWGLAEEAGLALGWLWTEGIDATAPLLGLLSARLAGRAPGRPVPGPGRWRAAGGGALCPIDLGAALLDRTGLADGPLAVPLDLGPVEAPILLVPFLVRACELGQGRPNLTPLTLARLTLEWPGGRLEIGPGGVSMDGLTGLGAETQELRTSPWPGPALAPEPRRSHLPAMAADVLKGLEALALRTTVPPSETSRSGAGSATPDSD